MVNRLQQSSPSADLTAFTLVEMLVVIAIIGILTLASVGLFNNSGAKSRKASVDTLTGLIEQARIKAITTRSHVFLAVAEPGDLPDGEVVCRIGLFQVSDWKNVSETPTTITATQLSRWTPLNHGVVLMSGAVDGIPNPLDMPKTTVRYRTSSSPQEIQVHLIAFHPRGGLQLPAGSTPIVLRIAEGNYRNGEASPNSRPGTPSIAESRLKIGRVVGRPYRMD